MSTSANPNGYIAIVITYAGSTLTYDQFLKQFCVTLPGGATIKLGADQYYAYDGTTSSPTLSLANSITLKDAASAIEKLLPSNATSNDSLKTALKNWATNQAASPGETTYANLYLSHFTGGRIFLSNGDLKLKAIGEPVPASPNDKAYDLIYGIVEPYIAGNIEHPSEPGNLADISDIDWFSFPITLQVWNYDFAAKTAPTSLTKGFTNKGGSGQNLFDALHIPASTKHPTNQFPNASFPTNSGSTEGRRLVGPPSAPAPASYYTDPANNPFPYHQFEDYLTYLKGQQSTNASLFTLSGTFAGIGANPTEDKKKGQTYSFEVDFSNMAYQTVNYPSGSVQQIKPDATIVFKGSTSLIKGTGSKKAFTITLPWAKGTPSYSFNTVSNTAKVTNDAIHKGWLKLKGSTPTGPSGKVSPVVATAKDTHGTITPISNETNFAITYSVNKDPLTKLDNLYNDTRNSLTITGASGLTCTASATSGPLTPTNGGAGILIASSDSNGNLSSIEINDNMADSKVEKGTVWKIPNTSTLGNNNDLTITLAVDPQMAYAFITATATYTSEPTELTVAQNGKYSAVTFTVESAAMQTPGWAPDTSWTTMSQPDGIYGANSGYTIAGVDAANSGYNGDVKSLQNDVFGWIVADLLAAMNAGLICAPGTFPLTGKTVGESQDYWFKKGSSPYSFTNPTTHKPDHVWGAKAWANAKDAKGKPITNFWNTWAYNIFTVPGSTDAYNFAFTDRFEEGVLVDFNPPPANPAKESAVLLEIIVDDSPFLKSNGGSLGNLNALTERHDQHE